MVGGALAGLGWWMLRRRSEVPALAETIAGHQRLPRLPLSLDARLQVLLVGSGASLGREGAPRQFAAALGDFGTSPWSLTPRDREILLACAAGAGLAAVYSVPLGGALFAARIMLKTWHPRAVGTALITSSLAVTVASPVTHERPPFAVAGHPIVLSTHSFRARAGAPGARGGAGVQSRHGPRTTRHNHEVLAADSGDRRRRAADRHLFGVVSGTARQRQEHPDGKPEQRPDAGRSGRPPRPQNRFSPRCSCVPARSAACSRRHSRPARPWEGSRHSPSINWQGRTFTCPPSR
jgi:Voltage gated chloride channel